KPEPDKKRRNKAISEAIADGYKIRSALEEKGINAFTCKICEMIQACAYGLADISQNNANVFMELGMMLALGKPTIILTKKGQEKKLKLPSDLVGIEVIPFEEYLDIIEQIRKVVPKLPPSVSPTTPIQNLEKIEPQFAQELTKMEANIVREFKSSIEEAKLDTISVGKERKAMPPELSERLMRLEEKLEDLRGLGFVADPQTALLRGNYYYNQGKYKEALAIYNWALELQPDDPAKLNNRGLTYGHLERYDEALADFNRSLELRPDYPNVLNNRGVTYRHLERYKEALADLNRSLELRPDDPNTFYNLACLFSLQRKANEALEYLEKAIKGDEKNRKDAKTDKDFENIRDDPRFKKLTESD
ncbi:MAG: tetratricopeptide repeat protein, partial [Dehalococcoidia bacterium]